MITLDDYLDGKVSNNEVIDFVVEKLSAQGKQAKNDLGCVYRAEDGSKCGIGFIITDEELALAAEAFDKLPEDERWHLATIGDVSTKEIVNNSPIDSVLDLLGKHSSQADASRVQFLCDVQFQHDVTLDDDELFDDAPFGERLAKNMARLRK